MAQVCPSSTISISDSHLVKPHDKRMPPTYSTGRDMTTSEPISSLFLVIYLIGPVLYFFPRQPTLLTITIKKDLYLKH